MGISGGPDMINDSSLVLSLDAADRNSYVSGSTTWFDVSGNNNTGSLVNGPTFNTGSGGGINFDGVNDHADLGTVFNFTSENFSFSYWVNFNSLTTNQANQGPVVIYKGSFGSNGYYDQIGSNGQINFISNQPGFVFTSTATGLITTGSWYNISYIRNGTSVRIYVNGTDATQTSGSHSVMVSSSNNFRIANYQNGFIYGNFRLANMSTYTRALSASEVLQNYNAQKSRFNL
jgi:hypothetical protein